MNTSKAALLRQFNTSLAIEEFPLPDSMEPGTALVRVEMAGICGTDVHLWKGELPIELPVILGHETVGRLVASGPGFEADWTGRPLKAGDRVTWNSARSCGQCDYCGRLDQPTRCRHRRAYGIGYRADRSPHLLGGYAEHHILLPGTTVFRIPDTLPTEAVVGSGCALITAIHGIERAASPAGADKPAAAKLPVLPSPWNGTVVVQGAGPVGLAALAVAKTAGARRTVVIGGPRHRLDLAKRFGADELIDLESVATPADRISQVREITGGFGADLVVECVGSPPAVVEGMEMCRDGARYLILGHYCDAGTVPLNPHLITRKQLQIFGSWSSEPRHLRLALELLESARFPFAELVTHRFRLQEVNQAIETTAAWTSAKSVIVPN